MADMTQTPAPATPPCAELHLHLEGTLEVPMVLGLAERNGVRLPVPDEEKLRARYEFADLASFLALYYENMAVLRTAADFSDLTRAYLRRAAQAGVMHAEISFDPQAHVSRGVPLEEVVAGIAAGMAEGEREHGMSTALIACFLRDQPVADAHAVLESLVQLQAPLAAVGLDSAEVGYPPELFASVYQRAAALGLHLTAHAGEEGPASYVTDTLELLGAERIDHGINSVQDPALLERLAEADTALTVCPLSNVRLHAVPDLARHPLPQLLAAGVRVTINSDDPAYFGGYVDDNYRAVTAAFGWGPDVLAQLALHSVEGSFVSAGRKREMVAAIETWRHAWTQVG